MIDPKFTPGYTRTRSGIVHFVEIGSGAPLLLLHQAPRSWDEFRDLMPLLSDHHRVIAMDIVGFGASQALAEQSIETYAASVIALLDSLEIDRCTILGHQLGGMVAIEVSAEHPERIDRLILSGTPYIDEHFRKQRVDVHPFSAVNQQDDGRHLMELWNRRSGFYPPARPDLLDRFVRDVLLQEDHAEDSHRAISNYEMEGRTTFSGPVLCIGATADPISFPHVSRLVEKLPNSRLEIIPGGMVPLMEHMPLEVAKIVEKFLAEPL